MKPNSQLGLYRRQKDTYCRPISAFFLSRSRTSETQQLFNSAYSRSKDSQSCTTRQRSTQRPLYRSLRSATTHDNIQPHPTQSKKWKIQILNSACLKKIYQPTIQSKGNSVYNVNEVLSKHISCLRKENVPRYNCKKLKIMRGKLKISSSMFHVQEEEYGGFNAGVIGSKLL